MINSKVIEKITDELPNLVIKEELKKGGQKTVFKGIYKPSKEVVLKIICPSCEEEKNRAIREIDIASKFSSPFFAKLIGFGEVSIDSTSYIYIIEEFIDGKNLRELLIEHRDKRISKNEVKKIISSVLEALSIIEPLKLVHRDIKPENIIIANERIVLIDFGIARHLGMTSITDTYAIFGPMTPGYAAPEQIRNEKRKISIRTDLFSLGIVFYELLTGYNPFLINASSKQHVLLNTFKLNPSPLSNFGYHKSFDNFVFSFIQKSPHRRPASVSIAKKMFNSICWEE